MADIGKLALFTRAGAIAGAALALAACQTAPGYDANGEPTSGALAKPNFPIQAETPPPPPPPVAPPPAPKATTSPPAPSSAVPTAPVESKPLPPPGSSAAAAPQAPPAAARSAPPVVASAPVANPPNAAPQQRQVAATGAYVVKPGQGVDAVAREVKTTRQALIDLNDLKPPYALEAGQSLKVPGAAPAASSSAGKAYEVAAGDTLFSIARRFGVQPAELADTNGFAAGAPIRPGQRLNLPRNAADQGVNPAAQGVIVAAVAPALRPAIAPPAPAAEPIRTAPSPPAPVVAQTPEYLPNPPARKEEPAPVQVARANPASPAQVLNVPVVPRPPAPVLNASSAQIKAAGSGKFIWPVKGRVLNDFGPKADGQRNDGINIAAPMNASVHAAADGDVIYAGDQLREYGNLVLIRHPDGFVTAYGFLAKVNVKMKDKVTQNQEIGEVGQGANSGQPQLYFETRYARTPADSPAPPVDPMLVLPTAP